MGAMIHTCAHTMNTYNTFKKKKGWENITAKCPRQGSRPWRACLRNDWPVRHFDFSWHYLTKDRSSHNVVTAGCCPNNHDNDGGHCAQLSTRILSFLLLERAPGNVSDSTGRRGTLGSLKRFAWEHTDSPRQTGPDPGLSDNINHHSGCGGPVDRLSHWTEHLILLS